MSEEPHGGAAGVELVVSVDSADAGYAALEYGADAVCLDVGGVSATACGGNRSTDEVDAIAAYARSLSPRRRSYVGLDTLIPDGEIGEVVELLGALAEAGVEALVVRDWGVHRLARRHFPAMRVHAGAHLAAHDREGALALARTGFARVASAPELSLDEIRDVAAVEGIELEAPVHGALCYSYGGLCLFSSHAPGGSASRGRCAEPCRVAFRLREADGSPDGATAFPFSMKDLALADHLDDLISAGVAALGIEARTRSPLYVAAVTDLYRRLLDGKLMAGRARAEADIRTIFSRPWTDYFIDGRTGKDVAHGAAGMSGSARAALAGAAPGHRGTPIGEVESVTMRPGRPRAYLRFRTSRRLETHDGLRVEIPDEGRPFGFAIETMHLVTKSRRKGSREVFEAPAGSTVEVGLPGEYPLVPPGAVVRCSSSQEVKQRYGFARPAPGRFRSRRPVDVLVEVAPDGLRAAGRVADAQIEAQVELAGEYDTAKDASNTERAARTAFEKLGDTRFRLGSFELRNPEGMFVPASVLNRLRRDVTASLEAKLAAATASHLERIKARAARPTGTHAMDGIGQRVPSRESCASLLNAVPGEFRWSVKTDRLAHLTAFEPGDWRGIHEVVVDIARENGSDLRVGIERIADAAGRDHVRLSLPAITRAWERDDLRGKIAALAGAGWAKWQTANVSGWEYLRAVQSLDVTTDWPLYVTSRLAGAQLLDTGASGFTLLPPEGQVPGGSDRTWGEAVANCAELLEEFGPAATVVVYQDTPLFVSEACVHANLAGGCPGPEECSFESVPMLSSFGDRIVALREGCRTVVIHRDPFCVSDRLDDLARAGARSLRVDLIWRSYTPEQARDTWRTVRERKRIPGTRVANFERGLAQGEVDGPRASP